MEQHNTTPSHQLTDWLWNAWCILSVVGVWPRFIEPNLLKTTHLKLQIPHLPSALHGFTIVQISDLHLHPAVSNFFYQKLIKKVRALSPHLIAITGDFLCYAEMSDPKRLQNLLNTLNAPYGSYAVLGNHDYAQRVSVSATGDYDVIDENNSSSLSKGFKLLFSNRTLTKKITPQAQAVGLNTSLLELFKQSPCTLLDNTTKQIRVGNAYLNLCGLGEYTLGRCLPAQAYANYDPRYPGIVLLHNPDGTSLLEKYPGEVILSGHTHGGQINFPWIWKKFTLLENMQFKRGLKRVNGKWLYINRGIGSVMPFRWLSPPEILHITLETAP